MSQYETTDGDAMQGSTAASAAPPTAPGALAIPPRQSSWPKVIGIIAIVLGAFGTLGGIWGTIAPFLMSAMAQWFEKITPPGQPNAFEMWEGLEYYMAGVSALGTVLAVVLLVGGVKLVRHRGAAAKVLVYWAICKIIFSIAATVINWFVQQENITQMQQNMPQPGMPQGYMTVVMVVTMVLSLLWLLALPVFVLIWFSRRKVRDEIAQWHAEIVA